MRHLASVKRITSLTPIEGKDRIVVADVSGWTVIVNKADFNVGDLCVYCEPDSILPEKPEFEFLKKRSWKESLNGYLISVMKMSGVVSQGIVFPVSILTTRGISEVTENLDVTEMLGVKKYDSETPEEPLKNTPLFSKFMKYRAFRFFYNQYRKVFPKPDKSWPHFISKTDEERVQNCVSLLERREGSFCYVTEKLDGSSATYAYHNGKFIVASRNCWLHKPDGSKYWQLAQKLGMKEKLKKFVKERKLRSVVIQGELVGPGIQQNKYKLPGLYFYVFNVFLNGDKCMLPSDLMLYCGSMELNTVPILEHNFILHGSVNNILELSKGTSKLYGIEREGIVVRDKNRAFSFKAINPEFLVKHVYPK